MSAKTVDGNVMEQATPFVHQHVPEIQAYGQLVRLPIGLSETVCRESVQSLNQLLADTVTLRDLYKKHHWQVLGPTFYQMHVLFDKHAGQQSAFVDSLAERIQMLGGVCLAMATDIAETTLIPRPPKGREAVPVQIARLLHAHEIVLKESRAMARLAAERGDDGTSDLIVSGVIRTNERQVWFLSQHIVETP
jgi:starvation-inducible DNA-binding protein